MIRAIHLVIGLCLVASAVRAQDSVRQRFWAAIGPGYGSAAFSCGSCSYRRALGTDSRRLGGSSITAEAGWAPSRYVRLGMVYDGWLNGVKKHDSLPTLDFFSLIAAYSLRGGPGPFLEAGWGVSRYGLELGSGSFFDPVAQHDSFAAGWGQSYRLGVAPFALSYREGFARPHRVEPRTVASAIRIGNPASYERAVRAIRETDGVVTTVSDNDMLEAKAVIDAAGVGCEPASAASVAGTRRLMREGIIGDAERVVAVLTGHLLKDPESVIRYHQDTEPAPPGANRPIEIEPRLSDVERVLAAAPNLRR